MPSSQHPITIPMYEPDLNQLETRVAELRDRFELRMSRLYKIPTRAKLVRLALRELLVRSNEEIETLLATHRL